MLTNTKEYKTLKKTIASFLQININQITNIVDSMKKKTGKY